ncbi:MAG: HipA N-terminal domain-containing protein [Deltaproteobacteria bacterium]|nr:HipA N-terminal domain-containing protein [Candidatus Anaeroferrophillus wilburensis]MBN2887893.1 HipA N-terminal domain-containing protein [Deltaproteobacteria bacterium]
MRTADIFFQDILAGHLQEQEDGRGYSFAYRPGYGGPPISLTMPVQTEPYMFNDFPPFFDGLLPEGVQLDALLRQKKIDRDDRFRQLVTVGGDTVGAVTITETS